MDVLRFIIGLPFLLIRLFFKLTGLILKLILTILKPIIGQINWQTPAWWPKCINLFNRSEASAKKHAIKIFIALILLCATAFGAYYLYIQEQNRPVPIPPVTIKVTEIKYSIHGPNLPSEQKQYIDLVFTDSTGVASAAPIDKLGLVINEGVEINPSLKGEWKWLDDHILRFTADEPFVLGQDYTVNIVPSQLLTENTKLMDDKYLSTQFKAPNFYAEITNKILSHDPKTNARNAIFTVNFPTPVDKNSFEKNIELSLAYSNNKKSKLTYTVEYDPEYDKIAYIKSEIIPLADETGTLHLTLGKDIKGASHSLPQAEKRTASLNIPDRFGLGIDSIENEIITDGFKDKQLLNIIFNDPISQNDFHDAVTIWLLPKFPSTLSQKQIQEWLNSGYEQYGNWGQGDEVISDADLKEKVTFKRPEFEDDSPQIAFPLVIDAPANRWIYVQIKSKNLKSSNGYYMKRDARETLLTKVLSKKLSFTSEGSILPLSGEKKLGITTRNHPGAQVELYRVRPEQLQHFVFHKDSDFDSWLNYDYDYDSDQLAPRIGDYFTKFMQFNDYKSENVAFDSIDFTSFLSTNKAHPRGVFIVKLRPWNGKTDEIQPPQAMAFEDMDWLDYDWYRQSNQIEGAIQKEAVSDERVIVVTDIGIITKRNIDQTWHLFAQSIGKNTPIANAKVSVIAVNGSTLLTGNTDASGHIHLPTLAHFVNEQKPSHFLVESDGDFSFLPVFYSHDRMLDFSRFEIGGESQARDKKQLSSHLFSDRGVYRPGDTFNIGIITKAADWKQPLTGIPLIAEVYDPRYVKVATETLTLDAVGFNEISYTTAENSPTGEWRVELYLPGESEYDRLFLGTTTVNVKEFEPDRLKVNVKLSNKTSQKGWISPKALTAEVNVLNLFGTPAEGRRVTSELTLKPIYPYFDKYSQYQFYENTPNRDGVVEQLKEQTTNETGNVTIPLSLESYVAGTYQMNLLVEAFEAGAGRSVAATSHALVSPYDSLVGFKNDQNLNFINQGSDLKINLIAINPELEKIQLSGLTAELYEQKYLSVLAQDRSGAYRYESKLKETKIEENQFDIIDSGSYFALNTQKAGDYVLVIKDDTSRILNRISYSIAGNADISRDLNRNAELRVKLDKTTYKRGEPITLSISAPYAGNGLIAIERDKVYSWQWFKTDSNSTVQTITLPKDIDLEGNAYVTVQFIRDINSPEVFMSPLSYAALPFKISLEDRRSEFKVSAPKKLKSGQTLSMEVTTSSPQRVVLFAVDEGILQVARYKLGDPLDTFFKKRALEVKTAEILSLILPEYSKLNAFIAAAGGDGAELMDLHLNPFKRKRDKPVAYWSHIVTVDGKKTFDYELPDYFNGNIRIMAVSVSDSTMGIAQTSTVVRDDLILVPNTPTTVAPGDEFEVSVGVSNNVESDEAQSIKVSLEATSELEIIGEPIQTISIAPNRESYVTYRLRAKEELGGALLNFRAEYVDEAGQPTSLKRTIGISVRPTEPFRTQIQMGRMDGTKQIVSEIRSVYPNFAQSHAKASYSPLIFTAGLSQYLDNYPHLCTEQIVSRAIPLAVQRQYPEFSAVSDIAIMDTKLDEIVKILQTRQNSEGAFGLWQIQQYPDPYLTVHAVTYLLEAQDANIAIPQNMLTQANRFLRTLAENDRLNSLVDLRVRANAVYLLARQGEVVTNQVASIEERFDKYQYNSQADLTAFYLAATYKLLKLDDKANKRLEANWNEMKKAYDKAWWNVNYWDPLVIDANRLYLLAQHFPEKLADLPPQVLDNMQIALMEERFTTLSSAMLILALDKYTAAIESQATEADNLTIARSFTNDQQKVVLENISTLRGLLVSGTFKSAFDTPDPTQSIEFNNKLALPAWYSVSQSGYDHQPLNQSISDGLEVSRYFTDEKGNVVNSVKLGENLNVHVKIRANAEEGETQIALIDLLPGGFEVVQQTAPPSEDDEGSDANAFKSSIAISQSWSVDYVDVREDRVLMYGYPSDKTEEFVYQIKATNVGSYKVPPVYAEAMYNRRVVGVSVAKEPRVDVIKP